MPFAELAFNLAIYSLAIITALLVGSFIGAIILRLTTQILNYGLPAYWNTFKTVLLTNIVLTVFNYIMTANTLAPVFLREFLRPENTNRRNQGFIDQENYRMISQLTYQFTPTSTLLTLITITLMIAAIFSRSLIFNDEKPRLSFMDAVIVAFSYFAFSFFFGLVVVIVVLIAVGIIAWGLSFF
ncbi:MAG: hypothetical protein KDA65_01080 [Planctomycetaceae bacterium]|nr:hypothetical protein [Planctomycetaceae bacterium]